MPLSAPVVVTGAEAHVAIHYRPLDAAVVFSAEVSRSRQDRPSHWYVG